MGVHSSRSRFPATPGRALPIFHPGLDSTLSRAAEDVLRPSALVLQAALTSRSCTAPQTGQVHSRTANERNSSSYPRTEHRLELEYQRLTAMSVRPYQRALYSSCRINSPQPTSAMALARQ